MSAPFVPDSSPIDRAFVSPTRLVARLVKDRARAFLRRPSSLDLVFPGLSVATADTMIAVARRLLETERQTLRRWFGFGGEIPALNARAVLVVARARRRAEGRPGE